jgi:NAD(P)-dependent dehydrogenase (short-subunit alcohol dehydrogenase family)
MNKKATLIVGANSDIGKALALKTVHAEGRQLIIVSRDISFYQQSLFKQATLIKVASYDDAHINNVVDTIKATNVNIISRVFICHGVLHSSDYQPEKRLEDFSTDAYIKVIHANTITPMLWLKYLTPILTSKHSCKIIVFTARVGSISDNKLGGWYSYRSSKAAMNMLIKSAAIEFARRAKNIKLISFHPGTTDTPLSKPFQQNVPKGKLFTCDFVANNLLKIIDNIEINGEASFIDWEGKSISW